MDAKDLNAFDTAFWGHVGHVVRNLCRSIGLSITRGYIAGSPSCHPQMRRYFRRLQWASATYAIMADISMAALGGELKLREKITGRFADILAYMYMATSVLRRFEAEGRREEDLAFVHYNLKLCMAEIQKGFDGLFDNLKIPGLRWFVKGWIGSWSRINSIGSQASDGWSHAIASSMLKDGSVRDRLTQGIYLPTKEGEQLHRLENAFSITLKAEAAEKKIKKAIRDGILPKKKTAMLLDDARAKNVISEDEYKLIQQSDNVRYDAILVDDFSEEQYHATHA
jgi:acyl-CoA dehydrogenase